MKAEQQTRLYREHIENYLSEIYADRKEHIKMMLKYIEIL